MASAHEEAPADPYKNSEGPSPFRRLATIQDDVTTIKPDPAHTYAIAGWGKDLAGSALVLLCRLKILSGRSLQASFDHGYELFQAYCHRHGKSTSISNFSFQTLKVESLLG